MFFEVEHLLDFASKVFVGAARLLEERGATAGLVFECGLEEFIDFSPAVGFHPRFLRRSFGRATLSSVAIRDALCAARCLILLRFPRCSSRRSNAVRRSCLSVERVFRAGEVLHLAQEKTVPPLPLLLQLR